MRILLFDIDGTLLSTGGAGLVALREIFRAEHSVDDATEGIRFHGLTDPIILQSIAERHMSRRLTDAELKRVADGYADALPRVLEECAEFRRLPGVLPLLERLADDPSAVLGLATGNYERTAWMKLARARLDRFFEWGGFASDSPDRATLTRIAVQRGRDRAGSDAPAVVIGDTVYDVRCAHAAGADCLAVATGNVSEAGLREAGARWTLPHLEDPRAAVILGLDGAAAPPGPGAR